MNNASTSCSMTQGPPNVDYGVTPLLRHPGNGGDLCGTPLFNYSAMPDLSKVEQYMVLVDRLVLLADKEELEECGRILAMNLAHYKMKYGELTLGDGMFIDDQVELSPQQRELIVQGMETLVGVLGSVIQGLDEKTEH